MHDAMVTFSGWAGNDPVYRETSAGNVANFRVGCTPRLRRKSGDWVDGPTSWFSVSCWRSLADNVRDSVKKGDPVVVHGRLQVDVWDRDGLQSVSPVVQALYVGHDLNRGRSLFTRAVPPDRAEGDDDSEAVLKELIHDPGHESPQLDSDGRERDMSRPAVA